MCSLDIYNWYEHRFPDDFAQLIKIKHYNISELSFLLSKVWYKLDYGEKLLMCAVYYDDFNLAKQMLNENIMFRVNPFLSKRYLTTYFPVQHKAARLNSTSAVVTNNTVAPPAENTNNSEETCWCNGQTNAAKATKYRPSVSSIQELLIATDDHADLSNNSSSLDDMETLNFNSTTGGGQSLSYFFNQRLTDNQIYSPFYLAVKLNKLKMCQLFLDYMKQTYHTHMSAQFRKHSLYFYYHHTKCSNTAKFQPRVYLSHFLDESELIHLFVLTLMNNNFELAALLLNNCEKPTLVLNFYNLSEAFIKNKEFCLYLMRGRLVEANVLLKVATNRHQFETTRFLLDHLETACSFDEKQLLDLYKIVLFNSISIGDYFIFDMIMDRIESNCSETSQRTLLSQITLDGILNKKYTNSIIKNKVRTSIDLDATRTLATSKNFNFEAFVTLPDDFKSEDREASGPIKLDIRLPKLTFLNRLKLVNYLFENGEEQASVVYSQNDLAKIKQVT
jgi:hypothetical protein